MKLFRHSAVLGTIIGLILALGVVATARQTTIDTTPATRLAWDQPAATLTEAGQYRITAYTGANATKILANVNDGTATAFGVLSFTCTGSSSPFTCTSTATAGQLANSTAPGTYTTVLVAERRRADGSYAGKVVSQLCSFRFLDASPSLAPANLRFVAP